MLSVQEDSQQWEGKPRGRMVPGGQWSIPWDVQGTGRGAGVSGVSGVGAAP